MDPNQSSRSQGSNPNANPNANKQNMGSQHGMESYQNRSHKEGMFGSASGDQNPSTQRARDQEFDDYFFGRENREDRSGSQRQKERGDPVWDERC